MLLTVKDLPRQCLLWGCCWHRLPFQHPEWINFTFLRCQILFFIFKIETASHLSENCCSKSIVVLVGSFNGLLHVRHFLDGLHWTKDFLPKRRSHYPFWRNFRKTSRRPLTPLPLFQETVALFCNENLSFSPLKITEKPQRSFLDRKWPPGPPLGSFPKIHQKWATRSSLKNKTFQLPPPFLTLIELIAHAQGQKSPSP